MRSKHTRCYASVKQFGSTYTKGKNNHSHPPVKGTLLRAKIYAEAKNRGAKEVFKSAGTIAQDWISAHRSEPFLPKPQNLIRATSLHRQQLRPKDPTSLTFDLNMDYMPTSFFKKDITVNSHRHLMFATDQQMRLLQKAKRLYLDATFKVVKAPFTQLFSIHCFIRHGDSMKQVPLAYFLMSGKSKEDYKAVL